VNRSKKYIVTILLLVFTFFLVGDAYAAADKVVQPHSIGGVIKNVYTSSKGIPNLLLVFTYITGIMTIFSGILKLKEHVDNPNSTPISVPIKRLISGGALLSLPYMADVVVGTVLGGTKKDELTMEGDFAGGAVAGQVDGMIYAFVSDIYGPMITAMSLFAYIAAMFFLIVGIMRLTKTAQEGPKGPSGIGTITTFIVAGALFAAGDMSGLFVTSLFGDNSVLTYPQIGDAIVSADDAPRIQAVISAIMAFVNMIGFIAFLRGWFVLKKVADGGGGNASLAQAITFLIGGTIAINLGQFINVLQETVGVEGITFS